MIVWVENGGFQVVHGRARMLPLGVCGAVLLTVTDCWSLEHGEGFPLPWVIFDKSCEANEQR